VLQANAFTHRHQGPSVALTIAGVRVEFSLPVEAVE